MDEWFAENEQDRADDCQRAADEMGLSSHAIEKDLWVCWTLRELFRIPEVADHITFKGGTSLSKCWGLIERFSEDIDLVVDRGMLDCPSDEQLEASGSNARGRELERLKAASIEFVSQQVLPVLTIRAAELRIPGVQVEIDSSQAEQDTVLIRYESCLGGDSPYLNPVVKVETGSRSDTDPTESRAVQSYLDLTRGKKDDAGAFHVRAVAPPRTFCEKACLLHEEQAMSRPVSARLARHYYDLARLEAGGVLAQVCEAPDLFERVVRHRRLFFRRGGGVQDSLMIGTLRIAPDRDSMSAWRSDYSRMLDTMFFSEPPPFEALMEAAQRIEIAVNGMRRSG